MKNPNSVFKGKNEIALSARIVNSYIENCVIGDNVEVYNSVIKNSKIENGVFVGPFAHIRDSVVVCENAKIGNFVEIKNSRIGKNTKISHMSYVGDADVGENCNIGAGVIFCNYNGFEKKRTVIGDWVFVGSNVNLIAPLEICDKVFIAAGTTVSKSIYGAVNVVGRARQKEFDFENPYLKKIPKPKWFGTDGIRGVWGKDLDVPLVKEIAKSLFGAGAEKVLIGRDSRSSGVEISKILKNVFRGLGVRFIDVGVVSTPCLSYCTRVAEVDYGVMITASHNPEKFNGLKIFDGSGEKISQEKELQLEKNFFQKKYSKKIKNNKNKLKNKYFLIKQYKKHLKKYFLNNFNNLKIVLDCANGGLGCLAKSFFQSIDCVEVVNTKGEINKDCGALCAENLASIIKREKLDLGFAFDGDADRVVAINCAGEIFDGDDILFILAKYFKLTKNDFHPVVVGTVMTNMGTEQKLLKEGIQLLRSEVGDKQIAEKLKKHNLFLGAEKAGHIILNQDYCLGDGLLVALILVDVYQKMPDLFAECKKDKTIQYQKNISLESLCVDLEDLDLFVRNLNKTLSSSSRVLVRKSGTENVLRVMVESFDKKETEIVLNKVLAKIGKGENYEKN